MTTKNQHTYPPISEWPGLAVCVTTDDYGRRDYWSDIRCYWSAVSASWMNGVAGLGGEVEKLDLKGIKNDGINSKVTRQQQAERDGITGYLTNLAADIGDYALADDANVMIKSNLVAVPEANQTKRTHYHVEIIPGVWVDVYDVIDAWGLANPAYQHLIKKALKPGNRGHKGMMTDAQDIIDSAVRGKELIEKGGDL